MNKKSKNIKSIRDNSSRKEFAKEILKGVAVGGLVAASFALPNLPQVFKFLGIKTPKDRYGVKRAMRSLEKRRMIEIRDNKDGNQIMEITERGRKQILKYNLDEIKLSRPARWDGRWRLIAFDIPERHKRGRDALTRKMRDMEIYPLQKSLFVCPFECRNEIDFIGEIFNIRKFVHYVVIAKLDNIDEGFLKRHYNL